MAKEQVEEAADQLKQEQLEHEMMEQAMDEPAKPAAKLFYIEEVDIASLNEFLLGVDSARKQGILNTPSALDQLIQRISTIVKVK